MWSQSYRRNVTSLFSCTSKTTSAAQRVHCPGLQEDAVAGLWREAGQMVRHRPVGERIPQIVCRGARIQPRVDMAFRPRLQHDPCLGLAVLACRQIVRMPIRWMHLDREHLAGVEELQQQREPLETPGQLSQQLLWRLLDQLPDGQSLERSIGDAAGMVIAVAEHPGFADRAVAGQRRGQQAGQAPAAPEPILIDRLESQRIQRCFTQGTCPLMSRFSRESSETIAMRVIMSDVANGR